MISWQFDGILLSHGLIPADVVSVYCESGEVLFGALVLR